MAAPGLKAEGCGSRKTSNNWPKDGLLLFDVAVDIAAFVAGVF